VTLVHIGYLNFCVVFNSDIALLSQSFVEYNDDDCANLRALGLSSVGINMFLCASAIV